MSILATAILLYLAIATSFVAFIAYGVRDSEKHPARWAWLIQRDPEERT